MVLSVLLCTRSRVNSFGRRMPVEKVLEELESQAAILLGLRRPVI